MSHTYGPSMRRRELLERVGRSSLLLGLAPLSPHLDSADPVALPTLAEISGAKALLRTVLAQNHFLAGTGPFWVAGRFLNQFKLRSANHWAYDKLDPAWRKKYYRAGGEPKPYLAARALWETIPAPIRAQGPEALQKFHQGKDWSHIIPRAMKGPTTAENGLWWSTVRNQKLGANSMSKPQILQAKSVLLHDATFFHLALDPAPHDVGWCDWGHACRPPCCPGLRPALCGRQNHP